jgi:hypothetical protein
LFLTFRRLLVDVIISSKELRLSQAFFLERENLTSQEAFEVELNFIYDMVYTKAAVAHSSALLLGGLALDAAALLMVFFSIRAKQVYLEAAGHQAVADASALVTKRWHRRRLLLHTAREAQEGRGGGALRPPSPVLPGETCRDKDSVAESLLFGFIFKRRRLLLLLELEFQKNR